MLDRRWVSTSKNDDVERGESNGTMAGLTLRRADAGEEPRLHDCGGDDAGVGHRRERYHLQLCECAAPAPTRWRRCAGQVASTVEPAPGG